MTERRELYSIIFVDVIGYTAIMQKDEERVISMLSIFSSLSTAIKHPPV